MEYHHFLILAVLQTLGISMICAFPYQAKLNRMTDDNISKNKTIQLEIFSGTTTANETDGFNVTIKLHEVNSSNARTESNQDIFAKNTTYEEGQAIRSRTVNDTTLNETSTEQSVGNNLFSAVTMCPEERIIDTDANRYPNTIHKVRCNGYGTMCLSSAGTHACEEVKKTYTVYRLIGVDSQGKQYYRQEDYTVAVGCTCAESTIG